MFNEWVGNSLGFPQNWIKTSIRPQNLFFGKGDQVEGQLILLLSDQDPKVWLIVSVYSFIIQHIGRGDIPEDIMGPLKATLQLKYQNSAV